MPKDPHPTPSFSPYRKLAIGLHVGLIILLVFACVVMANYLSHDYYTRVHASFGTDYRLSPRTLKLVESLTNQVKVTLYYDKDDSLYSTVAALLKEYNLANPKISIQTVDYLRDAGAALKLRDKYKFLAAANAKDLVIFDCDGKTKPVSGSGLAQYVIEQVPNDKELEFRKKPTVFIGEQQFTAALLEVTSPRVQKAYFLEGHGEHSFTSGDTNVGYMTFAGVLNEQNSIQTEHLPSLLGTNTVPPDCSLLVIAGPTAAMDNEELQKIDQYLNQGGRLLALFNFMSVDKESGAERSRLDRLLAKWGVQVGSKAIIDPERTTQRTGSDMVVDHFGKHPIVSSLADFRLHVILPRSVSKLSERPQSADAPRVEEIAFTGPKAFEGTDVAHPKQFPLMVAIEKGAIKDVVTERGLTRIVVAGDSIFLANLEITSMANRDFAANAVNWLLERPQLLQGVGPRPIREYRVVMSARQSVQARWLLLGAMPGAVLLFGTLVWFRRRR
jgi:hypothetical protein